MHINCRLFPCGLVLLACTFLGLSVGPPALAAPRGGKPPVLASSADDPVLLRRLRGLSPSVDPHEARAVAQVAYQTGRQLAREWRVVWPPGLQNLLASNGKSKGGLCFQWAAELAPRLDTLKLKTLTVHWAESFLDTPSEHNVLVVTANGQPFHTGILLDNWRYSGRLAWGFVTDDREYEWKQNQTELASVLRKKNAARVAASQGTGTGPSAGTVTTGVATRR